MLEKIFVISFIVLTIHATMQPSMIFGKVQDWFANLNENISKPLYDCPACMSPWHGTWVYWLVFAGSWKECIIVVIAAMGVNYFISIFLPTNDN